MKEKETCQFNWDLEVLGFALLKAILKHILPHPTIQPVLHNYICVVTLIGHRMKGNQRRLSFKERTHTFMLKYMLLLILWVNRPV